MDIQRAMGQQNEDARLEQGKIQVRNGGLAKGKGNKRLAMPHSFLQGAICHLLLLMVVMLFL